MSSAIRRWLPWALMFAGCSGTATVSSTSSSSGSSAASSNTSATSTDASSGAGSTSATSSTGSGSGGSSGGGCSGTLVLAGLIVSQPLQLSSSNVAPGETLNGSFTVCNPTSATITLQNVDIAARPPGGTDANGPFGDLYDGPGITVAAGASKVITGGRAFTNADALGTWYAYVTLVDSSGAYHGDSSMASNKVTFTVSATGTTTTGSTTSGSTGTSTTTTGTTGTTGAATTGTAPSGLRVVLGSGGAPGHIVDGLGNVVQLHGADRSGTEFACAFQAGGDASQGFPGFFDGRNDQTGVDGMVAWHINSVRVPLNEDCWLGLNGLPFNDSAANYQSAIEQWVALLNQNGMIVILDLHWAAPGTEASDTNIGQLPMTDADHAPAFWTSVAGVFGNNSSVIFDLFNEPYLSDWTCWQKGGAASAGCAQDKQGQNYAVAGMAQLLQAVRNAGAQNVVILGGLGYSSDFSQWLQQVQGIPNLAAPLNGISINNVAASWHAYDFGSIESGCPSQYNGYSGTCNSGEVTATTNNIDGVLAAGFPVVLGELGISAYDSASAQSFSPSQQTMIDGWLDSMMSYMDSQQQGYVGWSWNTNTPPELISDDTTGAPSPNFGVTYKAHLSTF